MQMTPPVDQSDAQSAQAPRGVRPVGLIVALTLLLGIVFTVIAGHKVRETELAEAEIEVERQLAVAAEEINRRLQRYAVAATAGSGIPDAHGRVGADDWSRFVASFQLPYGLDGVQALGYARFADAGAATDKNASRRLVVEQLGSGAAPRPALAGVDLLGLPRLAETVGSAVAAREPTLSAMLTLPGADGHFVLMLAPVVRGEAVPGMVFVVVSLDDLFRSLPNWVETDAGFEVYDAAIYDHPEMLMLTAGRAVAGTHAHNAEVNVAGRLWRVQLKEVAGMATVSDRTRSELAFLVGGLLTLLLTLAASYQMLLRLRAEGRAREMTQTLRASEEKYRLVSENIDVGILVVQDGRFLYLNPAALNIIGRPEAEMLGQPFVPMVHPDDREMVLDRHLRRSQGEDVERRYDFRILRADGTVAWVQLSAVPIPWNGRPATLSFLNEITQRKLAEDALRRSEARYRTVIDAAPLGVAIVRDNRIRLANPALERLLGVAPGALAERGSFLDLVHPDDQLQIAAASDRISREPVGTTNEATFRLLAEDGRAIWIEGNSVRIDYEGGLSTLAFVHDISARRALEQQLKRALAERETILDATKVGIVLLSQERTVLWSNKAMREMFRAYDEHVGLGTSATYANPEDYQRFGGDVYRRLYAGETVETELRLRRFDGEIFWAHLIGRAVAADDPAQGSVWVVSDISRRKELEEALKQKTDEQNAILHSAQIGITHTVERRHKFVNQAFADMVGFGRDELIGQSALQHLVDPDEWLTHSDEALAQMLAGHSYVVESMMKHRDGSVLPVLMSGRLIDVADPERGAIWTITDLTERKQAEAEIRAALEKQMQLNELKSQFVSMTSHEFRTPLATILSSAELLRYYDARMPPEERKEVLGSIEIAVRRMTQMLDGILMIGRADAGKIEFLPAPCALGTLIDELAHEVANAAGTDDPARLVLDNTLGTDLWRVDEKLVRHILGNLLANAFKYSPDGGSVRLSAARAGEELRFEVSDQGIGIPPGDLPRLFETFHRAANVGTISGTGLGLAIVKRSVSLHGGRIEVDSAPGRGTRFVVHLPAIADTQGEGGA